MISEMYILGIETATTTGSVAIAAPDRIVAEYTLNIEATHSERLMATVDRVLTDTGLSIADLGGLPCRSVRDRSPGSGSALPR